ncbi:hypothetical protein [Nucisporomicrobium flavum]|uniref:hypothetical protein n=1 Tax=Nucisporomicrobium flavum TaxID=2785915 RepID=UPI0018F7BFE8|nr:hypothetical protein [Nucisporomicrobium flavum]
MERHVRRSRARRAFAAAVVAGTVIGLVGYVPAASASAPAAGLSETGRLGDRRFVVTGDRMYEVGAEDGTYPGTGWHIRGEMGGFWTPPIKLLDGVWFGANGSWLRAGRFTAGPGYTSMDLTGPGGLTVQRVDVVPDGARAALIGLRFPAGAGTVQLTVDAHSELLSAYPWGFTAPGQGTANLADTGSFDGRSLVFRDRGTPPVPNARPHDWAALVGSSLTPAGHALGPGMRGPQGGVVCGDPAPAVCDDGPDGRGTGGRLTYDVAVGGSARTVWFAVAGSDRGLGPARAELARALHDPAGAFAAKRAARAAVARHSRVDLPGDRLLQRSVEWSKQNLADSVQESRDLRVFASNQGTELPPPAGVVDRARWIGAGWPDYPWIFATDGEYTAFAAVAAGQFAAVKDHLRTLRDLSEIVNHRSGKVVHEVTPDGQVYYGTEADPGNTDETVKFPSAVALVWRWTGDDAFRDDLYDFSVRTMRYALRLDDDADGWPQGSGNVERPGMGDEKLDVTVYTIRGLLDLADLARSRGDRATAAWAGTQATQRMRRFEAAWWYGGDARSYADSLLDPGNVKLYQRYWIGATPMEAELPGWGPLAPAGHATTALAQRERDCFTGEFGFFHTGTGPTTDPAGNPGPSCDSVVSAVPSERSVFSLGNAIMAVAEGNYGRMAQQQRYTTANARSQLDPAVWEMPGAMPEILPSPDFGSNLSKDFLSRSSVLQAWGAYGVLWPVLHQQLGVAPDLGNGRLSVVPQVPAGGRIAGSDILVGTGHLDVRASSRGNALSVTVHAAVHARLTLGTVLPAGAKVASVTVDGRPAGARRVHTARGDELLTTTGSGRHTLVVTLR